jgi:hypothetical protein
MERPLPQPAVEACYRCGQPAELPAIGSGDVAGQESHHLPICQDCLDLLLTDAEAFWRPLRQRREKGGPDHGGRGLPTPRSQER